ncbi:large ribosomal subunit protein P2-like [Corticium candelabrum]|uniref:large ribosomal subunit protein P2-like n=1 Tax=Corticium candelabrum TaxID=121492 RepID=UPI002E260D11|nr:large ribosomal subunit protein P2-like [Corticium candelabrum]
MRYVAAYLLAVLGGNNSPNAQDIKKILGSVGIDVDDDKLAKVIGELNGKDVNEVIAEGQTRLATVSFGGVAAAGSASAAAQKEDAPAAAEEKEEKPEEDEESDEDMGFGLFD